MIKWHKQGIEVPIFIQLNRLPAHVDANYNGRIRLLDHASVEISSIRAKDEGWYECSVVFLQRPDDANPNGTWVYLAVTAPPVLGAVSPGFVIQREGSNVEMSCEATGIPPPTLTWLKDGKELEQSSRVSMMRGRLVVIRNVVTTDAGVYTCLFKNPVAQVSHAIRLVVKGADYVISSNAYILVPPKNVSAVEGTRVRFVCQAEAHPANITYQWFRNDVDVHLVTGLMARAGIYVDGSFIISSVLRDDTGWYRCQPTNGLGAPPFAEAYLDVTYLPRVLAQPGQTQIYFTRSLPGHIDCLSDANPAVNRVVWTKDDHPVVLDGSSPTSASSSGAAAAAGTMATAAVATGGHPQPRVRVTKLGSLVFRTTVLSDSGFYSCTPISKLGSGQSSAPIQVFVKDPPYFVVRPRPLYQRHPGQSVTMPCVAHGDPKPTIFWRKGEGTFPVISKALQYGGNLTIPHLTKDDNGSYECVASNPVTNVIATSLLIIELTSPHAPYNVSVRTSHSSAVVSWLPAYDGGHPLHYVLWYQRSNTGEDWHTIHVIPSTEPATSMTVHNLHANTAYKFMVLSRNRPGDGLFSNVVKAFTKALSADDEEEENIEGELPFPGSGDDEDYDDDDDHDHEDEEGINGDGTTESRDRRPDPPTNVTARLVTEGLQISWSPPQYSRPAVAKYAIEYRTVGPWVPLCEPLASNVTGYMWRVVSRGATYNFRVQSRSESDVHSDWSRVVTVLTIDQKQPTSSLRLSDVTLAGLAAALFLVVVVIVVAAVAVRLRRRRRKRQAIRYDTVKYFGPNQNDLTQCNDHMPEGTVCTMSDSEPVHMLDNHVTILPHTNHERKKIQETPI
jgi:hypothetical protein